MSFDYFCIIYNLITNWSLQQIFGTVELYSMIDLKFIGWNSDYSRYASEKMIALCLFWVQLKIYVDPLPISWYIREYDVSRSNVFGCVWNMRLCIRFIDVINKTFSIILTLWPRADSCDHLLQFQWNPYWLN